MATNVVPIQSIVRAAPDPIARRHNEGHGRRLTAAFEALEGFPALVESRNRVLHLLAQDRPTNGKVVSAVESDVALATAVLRLANRVDGPTRGKIEDIVQATEVLSPNAVQSIVSRARTFDFFERATVWEGAPERFRLHAVATQRSAERVAIETSYEHRNRLMVTALLHDIGKLVLQHAYQGYPEQVHEGANTPEERIHRERRELGVDHALVGGVLARRWGLPRSVASAIERHHSDDEDGEAGFVRLADMLAHYGQDAADIGQRAAAGGAPHRPRDGRASPCALRPALPARDAPPPDRPVPALDARGRRPQAPGRGEGLQADSARARALDEHRPNPPAQHLRQARRSRPRPGRPGGHRARVALALAHAGAGRPRRLRSALTAR